MPFYQWDTSAAVKLYVVETGSTWIRAIADPAAGNVISIAEVTRAEVASAMARRAREGTLTSEDRDDLIRTFQAHCASRFRLVPTDAAIVDLAVALVQRHPLRAYDAIQLATALGVDRSLAASGLLPLVFVSADANLITAAHAEGLATENPSHHPP
jgi:predicted nucleic acid-binding protein